jgi:hypothetical protein
VQAADNVEVLANQWKIGVLSYTLMAFYAHTYHPLLIMRKISSTLYDKVVFLRYLGIKRQPETLATVMLGTNIPVGPSQCMPYTFIKYFDNILFHDAIILRAHESPAFFSKPMVVYLKH